MVRLYYTKVLKFVAAAVHNLFTNCLLTNENVCDTIVPSREEMISCETTSNESVVMIDSIGYTVSIRPLASVRKEN